MIFRQEHTLLVPCPIDFDELQVTLGRLLPPDSADYLARKLLLRQWEAVLLDTEFVTSLRVQCGLCLVDSDPPRTSDEMANHLLDDHDHTNMISALMRALSDFYITHVAQADRCPLCQLEVEVLSRHWLNCHVVLQISMLLDRVTPLGFEMIRPSPGGAPPSKQKTLDDCFAGAPDFCKDSLSACALIFCESFFSQPELREIAKHRCLLCDALFFNETTLWRHLHTHNSVRTHNIYAWITQHLRMKIPCDFCQQLTHQARFHSVCVSLC